MGIGEAFGIKSIKLNLNATYSIQELYEKIKDVKFEAGEPQLIKNGFVWIIVFPQIDRNNQVQIVSAGKGKFLVQRSTQPAGIGKFAENLILEELSDGWSGLSAAFGDKKKLCMELADRTAEKINMLGL